MVKHGRRVTTLIGRKSGAVNLAALRLLWISADLAAELLPDVADSAHQIPAIAALDVI